MTPVLCAAVIHSALILAGTDASTAGAETYAEARRTTVETGKPMVVMVGTDWCQPCRTMKRTILPRLRKRGIFKKVSFALVNPDREGKLAGQITGGGPIPQLVMFRKTRRGWMRRKLIGGQSEEAVEQFIKDGLAADQAEKDAAGRPDITISIFRGNRAVGNLRPPVPRGGSSILRNLQQLAVVEDFAVEDDPHRVVLVA